MDSEATARRTEEVTESFSHAGLAGLCGAAASEDPLARLLQDDSGSLTAHEVSALIGKAAAAYRRAGLKPGERLLLVATAQSASLIALVAALSMGAEPALVPFGLSALELAACARVANASGLVGPVLYGTLDCGDDYLSTAALVDTIRILATLGPAPLDGAIDLSVSALVEMPGGTADLPPAETPVIATFHRTGGTPELVLHRQAALFADALSLVEKARINPTKRIVSTLPLATQVGLVAGPFAALVGASGLTQHGPFEARGFLRACDAHPGAHVVLPAGAAGALGERHAASLSSLILVSRYSDAQAFALPEPLAIARPMVDVYAFAEDTILLRRRVDGEALAPSRVTDKSIGGGLGARLNRARADVRDNERG